MKQPTLVILAAGMGSRYGKLKQMDAFGPNGETIIDYSIYDAINAGFSKVVFVIRESFKEEFERVFTEKFGGKVELAYVLQELDNIPQGYDIHPERQKPWGTAHAVWVAHTEVDGPFAVINADDYYGQEAYTVLYDYLTKSEDANYAVVGYKLKNTLSDHGNVNRGVCYTDDDGNLSKVVECIAIRRNEKGEVVYPDGEEFNQLDEDTLVSMNMWAFKPSFFDYFEDGFGKFLDKNGMVLKSEYFIPLLIDNLIRSNELTVEVLETDSDWFGVTYAEDKPVVQKKLQNLIDKGIYPKNLFA